MRALGACERVRRVRRSGGAIVVDGGDWQDVAVCLIWIALSLGIAVRVFRWE